ncbi:hypothetical protein BS47DRAFT_1294356, partial [Hydnum rufescens UP504]
IVVLGAGVIGLTSALKVQEAFNEANVCIVAETFPGDPKSIKYTSLWAGAHHVSTTTNEWQSNLDRETFTTMWEMSAPGGPAESCFLRLPQTEYFMDDKKLGKDCLHTMPNYRVLKSSELIPGAVSGVQFDTVTIDVHIYLNYLLSLFLSRGGSIHRSSLQHISQILDGTFSSPVGIPPSAVIVCAGLGARTLGGVEDKTVHPVRGQTVLLRAPWIKFGRTTSHSDGTWTYIIPRRNGNVIIGGTKFPNDWYPYPRPETTEDILRRAVAICPELVSPITFWNTNPKPTFEDLRPLIIEEGCGLRPGREGGVRLEVEMMSSTARENSPSVTIPVVYNYGQVVHEGYGYVASWGTASVAVKLLKTSIGPSEI